VARYKKLFRAIYAFGDSYVDSGNFYEASGHAYQPDPPYWKGRWMDGPNFVDVLAGNLATEPMESAVSGRTNYGFTGAHVAGDTEYKGVLIRSTKTQVQDYLANLGDGPASADALYVFFAGGDIVQPALSQQDGMDDAAAHANARQTAEDLVAVVAILADSGAVSFTVLGLFDMARIPIAPFRNPLTTALCRSYNEELAAGLAAISGARLLCFDFEAWMASISPHFEVTDALFLPGDEVRSTEPPEEQSRRANSRAYLFFDGWGHLSGRANQLLGNAVTEAVLEHMPPMR